jgi:hypothetical protein
MGFSEQNNWRVKDDEVSNKPAVAMVSGGRVGIFGARQATTHRHKLEEAVGLSPKGTVVLASVQSYHAQSPETQAAARWVCAYPECRGRSWPTKEALYAEHLHPDDLKRRMEAHCVMAISWVPADTALITGVMAPARGANAMSRITTAVPHALSMGDQVTILGVQGRHDAMASANAASGTLARVQAAETYEKLGNKKKAQELLDSIDFAKADEETGLVPLSVNGTHLALPRSQTTFDIAQELDGVFVMPADKESALVLAPHVVLRPRRPVLLSDIE